MGWRWRWMEWRSSMTTTMARRVGSLGGGGGFNLVQLMMAVKVGRECHDAMVGRCSIWLINEL